MNHLIIAECNFLEELIHKLYVGSKEFTTVNYRQIHNRLEAIRKEARLIEYSGRNYQETIHKPTQNKKDTKQ